MSVEYGSEATGGREAVASALRRLADGVSTGSVRLGEGPDAIAIDVPDELTVNIEFEVEEGEAELEVELEWPDRTGDEGASVRQREQPRPGNEEAVVPVGPEEPLETMARFELFPDRAGEWRWRLVHRNGNVIATSGEGYTQKHNAMKGLRSVAANAPDAELVDESETAER